MLNCERVLLPKSPAKHNNVLGLRVVSTCRSLRQNDLPTAKTWMASKPFRKTIKIFKIGSTPPRVFKPYKYRDDCCRSFNKKSLKKSSRLGVPLATLPITVFPELSSDWEKIISKITSSHPAVLDWIFSHLKIKTTTLNDYQIVGNFWEKIHYKTTNHPAIGEPP